MSNPFQALDLSDDENITVTPGSAPEAKVEKKHHMPSRGGHDASKPLKTRVEMKKEEENLKTKKKHEGVRGAQPQPDVAHPGERSKIGLKKDTHVDTHKQPQQRRGREFERHSGTGRGKEIKKGGAGGHNWGKAGEETEAPAPAASPEAPAAENAAEEQAPVVEEDPSLTLEEYEKLRAQKRSGAAFEVKEARKVTTQVTGTVYKKDEDVGEGVYIKLGSDEHHLKKKPEHFKNKTKEAVLIDFKVRDSTQEPPARRGGRPEGGRPRDGPREGPRDGPRGAPRGGAPRGGRGGAPRGAAPGGAGRIDTADQSAFPKLGA